MRPPVPHRPGAPGLEEARRGPAIPEFRGYRGEDTNRGEVRGYRGEVTNRGEVRGYRGEVSQGNFLNQEQYGGSGVSS